MQRLGRPIRPGERGMEHSMRMVMRIAVALAVGSASLAAQATTVTYTTSYPSGNNPDPSQDPKTFSATDWNGQPQSVTLPQFNPNLGTLTGADLALYANIRSSGRLENQGSTELDINKFVATTDITVQAPGTPVPAADTNGTALLTVSPVLFTIDTLTRLAPGDSYAFGTDQLVDAAAAGTVSLTDLSPYAGVDNVLFPLFATTNLTNAANDTNGGGNPVVNQDAVARAIVSITYTYDAAAGTAVPEPASAAALGAGLLGFGLARGLARTGCNWRGRGKVEDHGTELVLAAGRDAGRAGVRRAHGRQPGGGRPDDGSLDVGAGALRAAHAAEAAGDRAHPG